MSDVPGILNTDALWMLIAILPLIYCVWWGFTEWCRRSRILGVAPPTRTTLRIVVLCITALWVALAALRPYLGYEELQLQATGRDIIAVVDVSNSMRAEDVSPSRLALARRKLQDLLQLLLESGRKDRLGIVVYAGTSELFAPLTADYTVLRDFISALSTDLVVHGGSDLEGALEKTVETIDALKARAPLVLVLSDGGDEPVDTTLLHRNFRDNSIPLVLLGIGTREGAHIPVIGTSMRAGRVVSDQRGRPVKSALNEALLQNIAYEAEGLYLPARPDEGDLREALAQIEKKRGDTEHEATVRVYGELGPGMFQILICLLLLFALIGKWRVVLPVILGFWMLGESASAYAQSSSHARAGRAAFEAGDYVSAETHYAHAVREDPREARYLQGLGSAQYKQGHFEAAAESFEKMANAATTVQERFDALYNKGNAALMQNAYDRAIAAYDEALTLKEDERARKNKEIAELRKQITPTPPPQQSSESASSESQPTQSSSNESSESNSEANDPSASATSSNAGSERSNSSAEHSEAENGENSDTPSAGSESSEPKNEGMNSSESAQSSNDMASNDKASSDSSRSENGSDGTMSSRSSQSSLNQQSSAGESNEQKSEKDDSFDTMPRTDQPKPQHDSAALREREAQAWLDTLPDTPMLPRGDPRWPDSQGDHTW